MCIRALDYCPPADITLRDYARDADGELNTTRSTKNAAAWRQSRLPAWRIVPEDVRTLSVDGLLWRPIAALTKTK
jgi:hypothetical protein